jgi:hypothetical protein
MSEITEADQTAIATARNLLESNGYVVLRERSHRLAQERQRVAEALRESEERAAEHARAWARDCLAEQRRLAERCTFLYGAARAAGCTDADLRGPDGQVLAELDAIDQAETTNA